MDAGGTGFAQGKGAGAHGGTGGVDIVDEEDVFAFECFGICGKGGGGELEAGGAGFGGLRVILADAAKGGDVTWLAGCAGQLLRQKGGMVVATRTDARGMAGDGHEKEIRDPGDVRVEEFGEGFDEGYGVVEFELEDGVAEGFLVEAWRGEGCDGGRELRRQEPGGVPPWHFAEAGGAEAQGFGGREVAHAAGAGWRQDDGKQMSQGEAGGLANADKWLMHGSIMTENLFDTEQMRRRNGQRDAAPVRDELTRRLEERLDEVKGGRARVLRVTQEDFLVDEPGSYNAVVVDMVLPLVEDVPVFLLKCVQALRGDGLLLASTLGIESFREFRAAWAEIGDATGHVVPLTDVREGGALLQRLKLALPVVDRDVMTVTFPDFAHLYASLRSHGVGNFFAKRPQGLVTPQRLGAMENAYVRLFPRADGRVPVTLEVVYLHGFKPAEGQPVAAKRGSGKVSLVRIVGDAAETGTSADNN